jgi:hypothetical protein
VVKIVMAAGISSRALLLSINNTQQQHHCCQTFSFRTRRRSRSRSSLDLSALPLPLSTRLPLSRPAKLRVLCQSPGLSGPDLAVQDGQDRLLKVNCLQVNNQLPCIGVFAQLPFCFGFKTAGPCV